MLKNWKNSSIANHLEKFTANSYTFYSSENVAFSPWLHFLLLFLVAAVNELKRQDTPFKMQVIIVSLIG
jgi:hypothetical protein